jgi:Aldehyde dehydrogenase family
VIGAAQGGTFFEPTALTDVTTDMVITKKETFGPVAPLYRFKTEADAVKMAKDTEFGLASYFYSRDVGRIWRVAEALEYGIVGINEGIISTEPLRRHEEKRHRPIWRITGARNTASRNSSKSNTSAWAASTIEVWESAPGRICRALTLCVLLSQMLSEGIRVEHLKRAVDDVGGLLNNFVGAPKYGVGNFQAERPRSLQIND